jgi:cytochrome oxidase Cu insertion factor (SCO1/SenC/PrrC family)
VTSQPPGQPEAEEREAHQDQAAGAPRSYRPPARLALILGAILGLVALTLAVLTSSRGTAQSTSPAAGPSAIGAGGGFPIGGRLAPNFTLVDQFGRPVSFSSLRGKEVALAFIDSHCTTVCPLTAEILRQARNQLGPADSKRVALVAVNANPAAARVADVYQFSAEHGMLHQWMFLTGSPAQLDAIYREYQVYVAVQKGGGVEHDSATFIIGPDGRERLYYETLDTKARSTMESETQALLAGMRLWLPR